MRQFLSLVAVTLISTLTIHAQCLSGNCFDGRGTYLYPSGAKYIGQFKKGKIQGKGILYFSNGNKYSGDWVDHYRQGKGELVFADGGVYNGEFYKSKFSGKGTLVFKNKDKYIGAWANDEMNGHGKYFYHNGDRYEGNFKSGKLHGKGTMYYSDGDKYVGNWKENYKEGYGTYHKNDGRKVSGQWQAGKLKNKESKPSDVVSGSTSIVSTSAPNSSSASSKNRNCNTGNCISGLGTYTYGDGTKWVGEFSNGKPQGQGTCFYSNGDKYEGGWKLHSPHGEGTMYYQSGRVLGAVWNFGTPIKEREGQSGYVKDESIKVDKDNEVKIWAVVVGVARYTHMPVLKYTDDDAYHIYAFLKSPEGGALPDDQIRVLIDDDATKHKIMKAMQQVFFKADENDVVVMYFSGHGLPGSFLPVDFDGFNNKLFHDDVKRMFAESKAKHKICIADACHSGSLMAMRSTTDHSISKYYKAFENSRGGTALLLSSKGDEYSLEDHGLRQGIFSHYLIRGLKGEADTNRNKIVTIKELFDFVYTNVKTYTSSIQTPTLTGVFDNNMPISVVR